MNEVKIFGNVVFIDVTEAAADAKKKKNQLFVFSENNYPMKIRTIADINSAKMHGQRMYIKGGMLPEELTKNYYIVVGSKMPIDALEEGDFKLFRELVEMGYDVQAFTFSRMMHPTEITSHIDSGNEHLLYVDKQTYFKILKYI